MFIKLFFLTIFSSLTLIACSSTPIDPKELAGKLKDKLTTDIKVDGLKLFTYQASLVEELPGRDRPERTLPHQERMQDPREQRQSWKEQEEILEVWGEQVDLGLRKTLEMTGYCREGYFELSRIIEPGRGEIRGECKEGATDSDRKKFVNF